MGISNIYSKRQKKLRGEMPDIYQYEEIPKELRVQIVHIIKDTLGDSLRCPKSLEIFSEVHKTLCKEYGKFFLVDRRYRHEEDIFKFFLSENNIEYYLDIIELFFRIIDINVKKFRNQLRLSKQQPEDAINELNERFKEFGVGFQYEEGLLIRVDSQFLHAEVVKPVLYLLGKNKAYEGASDEFLAAHNHYRHKRYKECLNDCLKSFESLMKAIHKKHSWNFNRNDTAKKLIGGCFNNGLIPTYLQTQFSSFNLIFESGVPTIRNKQGGHGQGHEVINVPEHLASYTLHLTASNLLFLMKCEEELK